MHNLNGLRILNTRPEAQAVILHQQIQQLGGISIDFPTIEIKECAAHWIQKLPNLSEITFAIFISTNAVNYFFNRLNLESIPWSKHIQVIAIGESTAKSLTQKGISLIEMPLTPDSEQMLKLLESKDLKQKKVLLIKGKGGRTLIEDYLRKQDAQLTILSVYQRVLPIMYKEVSNSLWRDDAVDIILLTSEQSIHNLFKLFNQATHDWLKSKHFLVISERLAQVASQLGINKIKISHPHRIINTLLDYKDYIHGNQQ